MRPFHDPCPLTQSSTASSDSLRFRGSLGDYGQSSSKAAIPSTADVSSLDIFQGNALNLVHSSRYELGAPHPKFSELQGDPVYNVGRNMVIPKYYPVVLPDITGNL